jgi:Flp pilus assembly protein TadG
MAWLYMNVRSSVFGKPWFSDDRGSAAIEFSLVLPVFLVMITGIFWVGWAAQETHNIRFALAEGARALQLEPTLTQSELQTLVRSKVLDGHDPEDVSVTLTIDPLSAGVQLAHTTASYPLTFTVPLVGSYSFSYSVSMTVPVAAS